MSSNNFVTAIIPQLSSTKAPLPASSLPKTLIAFCLLALISASRASTTPKLPHLLAMEDLLAGVVDPEMEMEVEMMDLQAISSGLGELQVPEPMEMEGPPSSLQEVLQAQEEEETKSGEGANQPGEPHKASRKLLAYAAIARPHLKKISPMPPPLSEEMSRKANEGLGPGPAVHIGTSGLPEFATKPDKRGIYSYFVSTGVKQVFKNLLVSVAALFIGGILETVCLFLLSTLYAMFSSPIQLPGEANCTGESAMEVDGQPLDLRPTPVGGHPGLCSARDREGVGLLLESQGPSSLNHLHGGNGPINVQLQQNSSTLQHDEGALAPTHKAP